MQCKSAITHKVSYLPNTFLASEGCKMELSITRVQDNDEGVLKKQKVISLFIVSHLFLFVESNELKNIDTCEMTV